MEEPYLFQIWALPALENPKTILLTNSPRVTVRMVEIKPPTGANFFATLFEMEGSLEYLQSNQAIDHFRKVLTRFSFFILRPFNILNARIVPKVYTPGRKYTVLFFEEGPPAGLGFSQHKIGYPRIYGTIYIYFFEEDLPPQVEGAMNWFLKADVATNVVDEYLSYWIGLEMLAPPVTGPWHCQACGNDVAECPHCGKSTKGPKSVQTIRQFFIKDIAVEPKEFRELYKLRNKISHGEISLDLQSAKAIAEKALRLQQLLLTGIKKVLKWPEDQPPLIPTEGPGLTLFQGSALRLVIALPDNARVPGPEYYNSYFSYPDNSLTTSNTDSSSES